MATSLKAPVTSPKRSASSMPGLKILQPIRESLDNCQTPRRISGFGNRNCGIQTDDKDRFKPP